MAGPTILLKYNLAPLVLYIKHFGLWSQSACAAVMSWLMSFFYFRPSLLARDVFLKQPTSKLKATIRYFSLGMLMAPPQQVCDYQT